MTGAFAIRARLDQASVFTAPSIIFVAAAAVIVALAFLPLSLAILLVTGGCFATFVFLRPVLGLAALAVAVPFGSLYEVSAGGMGLGIVEPLVAMLLVGWLAALFARRERRFHLPAAAWPLLCLLIVISFELTLAPSLSASFKELLRWGELLVVAVAARNVIRTRRQLLVVVSALVLSGLAEALIGWYQFFLQAGPPSFALGRFLRAYGTFNQPNPFAGYLIMVWPLAVTIVVYWLISLTHDLRKHAPSDKAKLGPRAMTHRHLPRDDRSVPRALGLLAVVAVVIVGAAILMSFSRGAWLGVVVGLIVLAGLYRRRLFLLAPLAMALISALMLLGQFNLLPGPIAGRIADTLSYFRIFDVRTITLTPQNWAIVERMSSWQAAWQMFVASPVFGVGPGHYNIAYARFGIEGWPQPLGHAHNYYLNILAEMGVIGLIAYLASLGSWFCSGLLTLRRLLPSGLLGVATIEHAVVVGVLGSLAAAAVHNGFDNLYVHGMNVHIGLLLGLMLTLSRSKRGAGRYASSEGG